MNSFQVSTGGRAREGVGVLLQQLLQEENKGFARALCDSVYLQRIDLRSFLSLLSRGGGRTSFQSHIIWQQSLTQEGGVLGIAHLWEREVGSKPPSRRRHAGLSRWVWKLGGAGGGKPRFPHFPETSDLCLLPGGSCSRKLVPSDPKVDTVYTACVWSLGALRGMQLRKLLAYFKTWHKMVEPLWKTIYYIYIYIIFIYSI